MNQSYSESINELATALSKAQGEITPASKGNVNPHFKSRYADLSSIWDACREPLSRHGLSVLQTMGTSDSGQLMLITTLVHSSGQWFKSYAPIISARSDSQGVGSALTYMRRYSLAAMVGVAPDDDDAEAAQGRHIQNYTAKPKASQVEKMSESQVVYLEEILKDCDPSYKKWVYDHIKKQHNADKLCDLPANLYDLIRKAAVENLKIYQEKINAQLAGI